MRVVLLFVVLAGSASAQVLPQPGPGRLDRGPVVPSLVGGALGFGGGGALGYAAVSTRADGTLEFDRASVYGFAGGAALGAGLGVPLGRLLFDEPTGSVWGSLGGALLGQAVGLSLGVEAYSGNSGAALGTFAVASPILTVGGATLGADR